MYSLILLASLLPAIQAAETVLGVYIFHRHGDRTPKAYTPANLTDLGSQQVYTSGDYYRSRYVSSSASSKIYGLNTDIVKNSQLAVSSPADTVLQNSATGFLQGLYPPTGATVGAQTLANGTTVQSPLNGYQYIPVALSSSGSGSEDNTWLQDATGCANAQTSSNRYFDSQQYKNTLNSTTGFYQEWVPVVNGTFAQSYVTFKNAYSIFDLVNVATIHNSSIPSNQTLTSSNLLQLRTLADQHEWGLAYNSSDNARAISGMQIAGEILTYLNNTLLPANYAKGTNKFGIQFGAYATFLSFFGLAQLPAANTDFYGITDYATSMVFELFTTATVSGSTPPAASDLQIRFLFHNGTASNASQPVAYPLFGQSQTTLPWNTFVSNMQNFSVQTTQQWCHACGNTTGSCAAYASTTPTPTPAAASSNGGNAGNGLSPAVNGVIGAMVTLAVILGSAALFLVVGGYRIVSKKRLAGASAASPQGSTVKA